MAKDKSKKSDAADGFAKPSEAPAGGDGWKFADDDNLGKLFLITPLRAESGEDKYHPGEMKERIVADVVEIDEKKPAKSEEHSDVWIFQGYLKGALRGYIGERRVLGRLGKGPLDRGNEPWILEDATKKDEAIAVAYLESVDPFATKGAGKTKADEKPAKKSKAAPEPEKKAKKGKAAPAPEPKKKSKKK